MAYKRRWRRSAITCIAGGNCERISMHGRVRLPNFDLLIISLSGERILVVSYWFTTDPYVVAYQSVNVINMTLVAMETAAVRHYPIITKHKDKRLFWPKYAVLIPNVTQFVQKAYIITNKEQKLQILDDWQKLCLISCITQKNYFF